jgi:hypothetical protein
MQPDRSGGNAAPEINRGDIYWIQPQITTTLSAAQAAVNGIKALRKEALTVRSLQQIYAA